MYKWQRSQAPTCPSSSPRRKTCLSSSSRLLGSCPHTPQATLPGGGGSHCWTLSQATRYQWFLSLRFLPFSFVLYKHREKELCILTLRQCPVYFRLALISPCSQDELELLILMPRLLKFWSHRLPYSVYARLGLKFRALCLLNKHNIN